MRLALAAASFAILLSQTTTGQAPGVLHIHVSLLDADQAAMPVARHALLISDNPATSSPRRVVTGPDGSVDVRLRGGNYTVESDAPLAFRGTGYEWIETLDVPAGQEVTLTLSQTNARVVPLADVTDAGGQSVSTNPYRLLAPRQPAVLRLWTPLSRASGFLVDARGLIVTSQRVVGDAETIEVQVSDTTKGEARVLASDRERDVAVLWLDAGLVAGIEPVPLGCDAAPPAPAPDEEVAALGVPVGAFGDPMVLGMVLRVTAHAVVAEARLPDGAAGGPLFSADGTLLGVTSRDDQVRGREFRSVPLADVCAVRASAEQALGSTPAPASTRMPVEPTQALPLEALKEAGSRRSGSLSPYTVSSSDFTAAFITPVMFVNARSGAGRTTSLDTRADQAGQARLPRWSDFGNWSDYVEENPPVLLIRVTPRLSESFWSGLARGVAMTQGVNMPAIKRLKSALAGMRAYCGENELIPIHRLSIETDAESDRPIVEGLYVFDPGAFNPSCGETRLTFFSEKNPDRPDSRVVDSRILRQIWDDFASFRMQ